MTASPPLVPPSSSTPPSCQSSPACAYVTRQQWGRGASKFDVVGEDRCTVIFHFNFNIAHQADFSFSIAFLSFCLLLYAPVVLDSLMWVSVPLGGLLDGRALLGRLMGRSMSFHGILSWPMPLWSPGQAEVFHWPHGQDHHP